MALLETEKRKLQVVLGNTASIMASAVARLYLASPNPRLQAQAATQDSILRTFPQLDDKKWVYTNVQGGLVFVRDRLEDTFLFQVYDLETFELRFEYELYEDMDYISLDPMFHCFEMEECVGGFSFSDQGAARQFFGKVRSLKPSSEGTAGVNVARRATMQEVKKEGAAPSTSFFGFLGGSSKNVKQKPMEISGVIAVKHQQHVGLNADGTLDLSVLSPEWKRFFKQAGITKQDLKNPETAKVIYQTIEQSGYSVAGRGPTMASYQQAPEVGGPVVAGAGATTNVTIGRPIAGMPAQEPIPEYSADILKQYYSAEQMKQYDDYKHQLEDYEKALVDYELEKAEVQKQTALEQWEADNKGFLKEHEEFKRASKELKKQPPPLPPRKETPALPPRKAKNIAVDTSAEEHSPAKTPPVSPVAADAASPKLGPLSSKGSFTAGGPTPLSLTKQAMSPKGGSSKALPASKLPPGASASTKPPVPARLQPPKLPPPPKLPDIGQGQDPVVVLQRQAIAEARKTVAISTGSAVAIALSTATNEGGEEEMRSSTKFFLNALAASKNALKDAADRKLADTTPLIEVGEKNLMSNLISALAERRKHISEDASEAGNDDDDWSD